MSAPNIAVVGATGLVGQLLLRTLEQRSFPCGHMRLLASARSAGGKLEFKGREWPVLEARADSFEDCDLVFFAAMGGLSRTLAPAAVAAGAMVIDKSGSWRLDPEVPLVVPEINGHLVERTPGIVASPNCSTTGFVLALAPLHRAAGIRRVTVTTLQAVSGCGRDGVDELHAQQNDRAAPRKVFAHQIADNVVPQCEDFLDNGYTIEEMKLLHETRKILDLPKLEVSMTCVRVPVEIGHSASILVETERPLTAEQAREALAAQEGIRVLDDPAANLYPTPQDCLEDDQVLVGRVRADLNRPNHLWMWQVANNLRKGACTNAVQIAECMMAE